MKKLYFLVFLFFLFLTSCSTSETQDPEKIAEKTALDYVKDLEQYKFSNGYDLRIKKLVQEYCEGCYEIIVQYDFQHDKKRALVNLKLKDWKVVDGDYSEIDIVVLTEQECVEKQGLPLPECIGSQKSIGEVKGFSVPHYCCSA